MKTTSEEIIRESCIEYLKHFKEVGKVPIIEYVQSHQELQNIRLFALRETLNSVNKELNIVPNLKMSIRETFDYYFNRAGIDIPYPNSNFIKNLDILENNPHFFNTRMVALTCLYLYVNLNYNITKDYISKKFSISSHTLEKYILLIKKKTGSIFLVNNLNFL